MALLHDVIDSKKVKTMEVVAVFKRTRLNLLSDISHLLKKIISHMFKSAYGNPSRCLRMPDHLVQMILQRFPQASPPPSWAIS